MNDYAAWQSDFLAVSHAEYSSAVSLPSAVAAINVAVHSSFDVNPSFCPMATAVCYVGVVIC